MISLQDGRKELFQWDTNRYVTLGDQITNATEIHFANGVFTHSIDVKIENNKALIPDILLQYAKPLKVWLFVGETNNGYTKVEHTFQVKERNKPSDYVYTPTEQISLQELIDKFEDFKDSIGNEVEDYLKENPITFEETDPTVPQWAKEKNKPTYTADEVGALSKDTKILTTEEVVDEIEQYMQDHPMLVEETDPTVPEWAKQPEKPTYTPEEIGAQPKGDYALKSEIPSVPVQSVNGKTGKVELTAEDVGALPEDTIIPAPYELPTASASVKGGVKVGNAPNDLFRMCGETLKMPEMALEESVTIEEDGVSAFTRYRGHRAFMVEIITPATGKNSENLLALLLKDTNPIKTLAVYTNKSSETVTHIYLFPFMGIWRVFTEYGVYGSRATLAGEAMQKNKTFLTADIKDSWYINLQAYQSPFPVGTKINIYGVSVNA